MIDRGKWDQADYDTFALQKNGSNLVIKRKKTRPLPRNHLLFHFTHRGISFDRLCIMFLVQCGVFPSVWNNKLKKSLITVQRFNINAQWKFVLALKIARILTWVVVKFESKSVEFWNVNGGDWLNPFKEGFVGTLSA